ncbi:acyltransferase family protein [Nocardia cyriacigeorgica]|uniref:acyltransferase family protein n=1 Tax=Nocardia cyriacigeorgica TaxID=135487 RepID=UPI003A5D0D02
MSGAIVVSSVAAAPSTSKSDTYRRDLDGLRGVAIALVVVFHIWFGRVSGGVDVFLVLSGFFFTGLLLRRVESTGTVGIGYTFRRTARRLLPALIVVLAAVAAGTVLIRPFTQWSDIARQILASLLYLQNWQLAVSWSDYLAADPSVSPLQHLWSMAIQGQYYVAAVLVVAVIAWLSPVSNRWVALRRNVGVVLVSLGALSFVYAAVGVATRQGWNYYDSFARVWELLAGAGLALLAGVVVPSRLARSVLAIAGIAAILACGWLIDGADRFPGPAALLPVSATIALILAGNNIAADERPWVSKVLASRPLVLLGDLSYGLYLWHWPLLIFYLAEEGEADAGLRGGALVLAVSLLLAYVTYRFVEQPLRLRAGHRAPADPPAVRSRRFTGALVAATAVVVFATTAGWQLYLTANPPRPVGALNPLDYPGAEALASGVEVPARRMRPTVFEAPAELPPPTVDGCIADWDTRDVVTCTYGAADAERTLAVVGSSHAEHWVPALQVIAEQERFRILVHLKMGCPLTLSDDLSYKGEPNPDCRDWSREVIDLLGEERPDWVFTVGTRPVDRGGDETPPEYLDVWTALSDRGLNVVALRDTPWLRRDGVRYRAIDCLARRGTPTSCGMHRSDALGPNNPAAEPAAAFPNVFPIDLNDAVCGPDICSVVEGNILIYHDEHHLTASYSRSLAAELKRQLGPVLGWW